MGISASIANSSRKYRTNEDLPPTRKSSKHSSIEIIDDNESDLRSVQSFRPSSPLAHQDARAFAMDTTYTKRYPQRYTRNQDRHSHNGDMERIYRGNRHIYHGSLDRGSRTGNGSYTTYSVREQSPRALVSQSASSTNGFEPRPARTMRDVREYLFNHPELLASKKNKQMRQSVESDLYGLSTNHKQMKTKQSVYMGLINPPIIYGAGAQPDHKQLRVDQKLYLNLVYPTIRPKDYRSQAIRSRPPLKQEGMVVVRKDDYLRQPNGYIRPLQQMQVARVPEASSTKHIPESVQHERTIPRSSDPSTSHRGRSQSQSLAKYSPRRASNDYIDSPHIVKEPSTSQSVKSERQLLRERQMNGFVKSGNSQQKIARQGMEDDEVVFTFNVDDLHLRKKTEIPRFERDEDTGHVVPLYFRKSLAYSPKYEYSGDPLSSPL